MDSGTGTAACRRGDRLSRLDDSVLGHILSFLPAPEAARAAALSRRWRHVFPAVHTLSFDEADSASTDGVGDNDDDSYSMWSSDYYNYSLVAPRPVPARLFATGVLAALLGRHRGARAGGAPLRALRIRFDEFSDAASGKAVDGMIHYAVLESGDALHHIDLQFGHGPICNREYRLRRRQGPSSPLDTSEYVAPTCLLSRAAALRILRLGRCGLNLPSTITLPSLDTLHLVRVTGGGTDAVQRLISACPRLTDLSLKACTGLTTLSVLETRLRTLAIKCCHDLASVAVDSSELRTFKYRGAVPVSSFLCMHGPRRVSWCGLDFCGDEASDPTELARLAAFLELFAPSTKYMRLKSARLGCRGIFSTVPAGFPTLCHLELTGMVPDDDTAIVASMTRILESSPSLETLSLFFLPEPVEMDDEKNNRWWYYYNDDDDEIHDVHRLSYRHVALPVPEGATTIRCLREINLVHYQGATAQRLLAKFLLRNAPVVDEVCCEFAQGPLFIQTRLMEEIKGWTMNKSANMMFF